MLNYQRVPNNISACESNKKSNHIQQYPITSTGVPSDHLHEDNHGPEAQPRVVAVSAWRQKKADDLNLKIWGKYGRYSSKWPWKIGKMMINHD